MDRVRLEPLERAELIDTLALQGLTYEHIRRAMGAQLGGSATGTARGRGGLLSAPIPAYNHTLGTLTLSSFSFLELTQGGAALSGGQTAAPEARIVRFNSADTDHPNHPIDISAARTAGTTYTLWARYVSVNTDLDARRKWSVALNAEVSATIATRERERVEFTTTTGATPADGGDSLWVQLLSYSVTSGGAFILGTYYHAHSAADTGLSAIEGLDSADRLALTAPLLTLLSAGGRSLGLIEHLALLRAQLYRVLHKGSADSVTPGVSATWRGTPRFSLAGVAQEIDDLDGRIIDLAARATALESDLAGSQDEYSLIIHARMIYDTATATATLETTYQSGYPGFVPGSSVFLHFDRTHIIGTGEFNGAAFANIAEALDTFSRPVICFSTTTDATALNSAFIVGESITPIGHDDPRDGMEALGVNKTLALSAKRLVRNAFIADPLADNISRYNRVREYTYKTTNGGADVAENAIAYALRFGENGDSYYTNGDGLIIMHIAYQLRLATRGAI